MPKTQAKGAVYINGRFLRQRVTGVQRYGRESLAALDELLAEQPEGERLRVCLLAPRGTELPPLRVIEGRHVGRLQGHAWEQLDLPRFCRDGLLLSFGSTGPLSKRHQIITVHDASVVRVPEAFSPAFVLWYRFAITVLLRRSPRALAVSRFTAKEMVRCFGGRDERIDVTTEGWQHLGRHSPDAGILAEHGLLPGRYVLAVSSPTPNKNFELVLKAIARLDDTSVQFAVVGAADPRVFAEAPSLESAPNVHRLGYVTDAQLRALYENALCFVFPSKYEGFGIPPLEALSCGCSVLASDIEAVREVCGDAARYFKHDDDATLAALIRERAGQSRDERTREAAQQRAALFSWKRGAELNLRAVEACL